MTKWKDKIKDRKILLDEDNIISNARYADDLIIYSDDFDDLETMVELLTWEFRAVGLEINASKCKIFTSQKELEYKCM